jgi:ribosomal protein S18 acetylase RimI-like enzyme
MAGLTPPRPLAESDDRASFDCGRDSLNNWFRRHAWQNQVANVSRTSVVFETASATLAGYVTLCAAQIERAHLPKSSQRNRPDPVPALLLGQLAVDRACQGKGYARSLMIFALTTAVQAAKLIGCMGVLTHPLDDEVRQFYEAFGFETLPFDPDRNMLVRTVDLIESGFF